MFAARRRLLATASSLAIAAVAFLAIACTLFLLAWTAPALHRHAIVHAWAKATIRPRFWLAFAPEEAREVGARSRILLSS